MGCGYTVYSEKDDIIFKHKGMHLQPSKVVKMFKKENGLLFRLQLDNNQWGFYNDTKEYEFHLRYTFTEGSDVQPLDNATITEMEDGTSIVELIVYPLETELFVVGNIEAARGRVEALPISERYKREKIKERLISTSRH